MAAEAKPRTAITVATAAERIAVGQGTVLGWIHKGELAAFVPPGQTIESGRRGPKTYRIFLDDWETFLRSRTLVAVQAGAEASHEESAVRPTRTKGSDAVGPDGVSRLRRSRG